MSEPRPPSEWQPIETAPKDQEILVWAHGIGQWVSKFAWWDCGAHRKPTHWMPLPEPPHE